MGRPNYSTPFIESFLQARLMREIVGVGPWSTLATFGLQHEHFIYADLILHGSHEIAI